MLVDRLVVGVAVSRDKKTLFGADERAEIVRKAVAAEAPECGVEVRVFDSLLIQFAEEIGASVVIRGLRAVSDFEYEFQMVGMNRAINQDIQTVFLMADPDHQAIASKLVREIARMGGDVSCFVPRIAQQRLEALFR